MALRWSKTMNAYNKYKHIFSKSLPVIIKCDAPISKASHLRDVIKFAHENHLPGQNWYGKVMVSPEEGQVVIKKKQKEATPTLEYPYEPMFLLLAHIQDGTAGAGFKFTSDTSPKRLNEMLEPLGLMVLNRSVYLELSPYKEDDEDEI